MMLERVLEPEVMDTEQEAHDYNAMDHSAVNQQFAGDLIEFAQSTGKKLGDVLDMGTGTALIPIELCRQESDCRIMAIDMAVNMLELARYNIEADSMIERITLAHVDAKKLDFEDGMFDTVMSNSIIHHIPKPQSCILEMVRVTSTGGLLFIRDLMRPDSDELVNELVETYAGQENEHCRTMFDESLRAALSLAEIRDLVAVHGFDPESVQQTTDRHWTWAAIKPGS